MAAFLQDFLGENWRTTLLGLIMITLGVVLGVIGGLLTIWPATQTFGVTLMTQGGLAVIGGMGYLYTRDSAASKQAVVNLKSEIKETAQEVKQDVAASAATVAKSAAQAVVAQELRR
jgi:hypothetical protein